MFAPFHRLSEKDKQIVIIYRPERQRAAAAPRSGVRYHLRNEREMEERKPQKGGVRCA
jgi:hypothetical protein